MNLKELLIAFAVTVGVISQAAAREPLSIFSGQTKCRPSCVGKFCCDDYCGKPLPCSVRAHCFECVDYCAKPLPCPPARKTAFCYDDFCPKPLPPICWTSAKNLRCVPSRLPPIGQSTPKQAARAERGGVEVIPATSSPRAGNEIQLAAP